MNAARQSGTILKSTSTRIKTGRVFNGSMDNSGRRLVQHWQGIVDRSSLAMEHKHTEHSMFRNTGSSDRRLDSLRLDICNCNDFVHVLISIRGICLVSVLTCRLQDRWFCSSMNHARPAHPIDSRSTVWACQYAVMNYRKSDSRDTMLDWRQLDNGAPLLAQLLLQRWK